MDDRHLHPPLFKTAFIVIDLGNENYSVPLEDEFEVPEERRNVRLRVDDQGPRDVLMGDGLSMDPYHVMSLLYDDDIGRGLKFLGYWMEAMMHRLSIALPVGASVYDSYIPTWEER
ncbi:unnamed protein product [Lactuca virosa]|uniref:Uncharacterized protein n=1 Tax=Lactuca virosa TaxID=75947 RepID=A0AAU9MKW4_9ASTR|nr:unnamed protein product [Lactuca virosa]